MEGVFEGARVRALAGRAQAFSSAETLFMGLVTAEKTGSPSFSFLAMAKMQQSAAIATTAAAMRPPTSPDKPCVSIDFELPSNPKVT